MCKAETILLLLVLTLVPMLSTAQTVRMVSGNGGVDAGICNDATNPCKTITYALGVSDPGDILSILNATYTESLVIDKTIGLFGQSRSGVILQTDDEPFQGDYGINDDRVITVTGGTLLVIHNLTIRHGVSTSGGGLEIDGVDLNLENVRFDRNGAGNRAGALRAENNTVTMTDVDFIGNRGGQTSGVSEGGALYSRDSDLSLTRVRFENNLAGSGGGLFFRDATASFEDVEFVGNTAEGEGGGVALRSSSPEFFNVSFRGNNAGGSGGAIYTVFDSAPALTNVLIAGNRAGSSGGGIHFQSGSTQSRVLINVTITGNRAVAGRGGGIFKPDEIELRNTIVWNNSDINGQGSPTSSISDFSTANVQSQHSLLQGYSAGEFAGSGSLDGTDSGNAPTFVAPLSPVGAPSQLGNLRLAEASPLIDMGNNALVSGISVDLDGLERVNGPAVDLGPYEFGNDGLFADRFEQ